jgi:hypothetical protein
MDTNHRKKNLRELKEMKISNSATQPLQNDEMLASLHMWMDITHPHCAIYTGSMTHGISFTNVMAPVIWYNTFTSRICSQGIGMFSRSFITA